MDKKEDFEVLDTEEYRSPKDQEFSHQALVMMAMKKVLEYGCQEMIAGYYSTEEDFKGKKKIVYKQDIRKAFIESVKTLRMIMICDFDEDAKKTLKASAKDKETDENLIDKLNEKKKFWLEEQKTFWDNCTDGQKQILLKDGKGVVEGYFNTTLQFYQQYLLEELEIYREIFEELTLLTERKHFYVTELAEA